MRRVVIACLFVGACARVPSTRVPTPAVAEVQVAAPVTPPPETSCARRTQVALPSPVGDARQGSAVALARAGDRLLAYVADADSRSVHTIDVDGRRELVRTRVPGTPRQLLVLRDGRVAATLSDGTRLAVLEPSADPAQPLAAVCERQVATEPWGIAASPDDARVVVTSGWGSALTVFDGATFAVQRVVPVARDPRSVLVDDTGTAFVSHLVGARMSAVDLDEGDAQVMDLGVHKSTPRAQLADMVATRTGSQGYALARITLSDRDAKAGPERILAPMVSVDPGEMERRSSVYYGPPFDGVPKESPIVSVVDPGRREALSRYLLGASDKAFVRECLLPRAAAVRTRSASLLVACMGIDAVLDLDALATDPLRAERRRFDVPTGPEGIAVDEASGRAVVFSQLAGSVTVLALDDARAKPVTVALDYHPDPALAAAARGRQLFYRTDDTRISNDGVACSSCHMDARDDSITWTTPMGPRQTPMLAGRLAGTQPYGWEGDRPTLADYIGNTVTRLGGQGLQPADLEDLSRFLLTVAGPPPGRPGDLARRGEALFNDPGQGCAGCHLGATSTDATPHGLGASAHDSSKSFDTPSLRFVGGTAPYFHDGRYATLEALLADPASIMGHTASLPEPDRAALAAYLRSL